MAAELIGRCKCPVCSSDKARLTLARSMLSVVTCNACNFQGFARSDRSDELLRARVIAEPEAKPEQKPEPAPIPAPAIAAPPPPAAPQRPGWSRF